MKVLMPEERLLKPLCKSRYSVCLCTKNNFKTDKSIFNKFNSEEEDENLWNPFSFY
jgi:hypothetical protein